MFKKAIHFVKYNNITVFVVLLIFAVSGGVFAQTEVGQEFIGEQTVSTQGVDNTLLLEADLDSLDMDYRIEKIESDDKYYYVTYTFLDLALKDNAWEYILTEKMRKVSLAYRGDLGEYLAEELSEEYNARLRELREAKALAERVGEETRIEVELYSGVIGQTLDLAGKVFPGYEPVKVREVPSPIAPERLTSLSNDPLEIDATLSALDDLTSLYDEYMERVDPDYDDVFGDLDNCPNDYNPEQADVDLDGIGDICDPINNLADEETATSGETATGTDGTEGARDDVADTSTEETLPAPVETEAPFSEGGELEDDGESPADVSSLDSPPSGGSPAEPGGGSASDDEPEVTVVELRDVEEQ